MGDPTEAAPPSGSEAAAKPPRSRALPSRRLLVGAVAGAALAVSGTALWRATRPPSRPRIEGIVWQPDNATVGVSGRWDALGIDSLLIQWTVVDGQSFVEGAGLPTVPKLPDWSRIAREPWARRVILGLAGRFGEREARADIAALADVSLRVARLPTPLDVTGWYFPVEVDPTWQQAPRLADVLRPLPRPLWISVYDSANVGAETLADWLDGWLPPDIGVFFQDGVGVHARTAEVARRYADTLARKLGPTRLKVIAEAFRPKPGGGFRAATADELAPQLAALQGLPIYLFDGPHYVDDDLVGRIGG